MDPQELRSKLYGVIAFPVTPFKKDLTLDHDGLRNNLERLLEHPICAVIAAGGTGEVYSLTPPEYLQDGDLIETEIEGIGVLQNRLTASG